MLMLWNIWNSEAKRGIAVSKLEHSYEIMRAKTFPQRSAAVSSSLAGLDATVQNLQITFRQD